MNTNDGPRTPAESEGAASARWIKRHVHGALHTATVRCLRDGASIVEQEAASIAAEPLHKPKQPILIAPDRLGIALNDADFRHLIEYPLRMTTARDVMWSFHTARAAGVGGLRKALAGAPWSVVFPADEAIAIKAHSQGSRVYHEGLLKEEVARAFAGAGLTLSEDRDDASQLLEARLIDDRLTLSVSLAGRTLYHRGYRELGAASAPAPEDLAAIATRFALQLLSDDRRRELSEIFAPFAGSGTLGFEAWTSLSHVSPGTTLPSLAVERMPCCPIETARHLRAKLREAAGASDVAPRLRFVELDPSTTESLAAGFSAASTNLSAAIGRAPAGDLIRGDALQAEMWRFDGAAFLAANPPYGERLGSKSDARAIYSGLGARLEDCARAGERLSGYVLAPSRDLAPLLQKNLARYRTAVLPLSHGGLPVSVVAFTSP